MSPRKSRREPEVSGGSRQRREHGLELLQRDQPEIRPARAEVGYQEAASRSHQGGWTRTRLAIPSLAIPSLAIPSRSRGHRRVHHQAPRRGPPAVALAQELWLEALTRLARLHHPGHRGRRIDRAAARAEIPPLAEGRNA